MLLSKAQDIFQLKPGDVVTKRNLSDLIQYSKVDGSEYWAGPDYRIGNTPQQGINWIGALPDVMALIIKTKSGAYADDGWADDKKLKYRYSFKARKGPLHMRIRQTRCLLGNRIFIIQSFCCLKRKIPGIWRGASA